MTSFQSTLVVTVTASMTASMIATVATIVTVLGGLSPLSAPSARAQLSPNCERNGRRDYCAITPVAGATNEKQAFDMITFADHTVYEVMRNLDSCKKVSEKVETCNAKIITPPGNQHAIPAFYRRTFYEGGVKQEYVGRRIHLTYFFLD